MIGLRWHCQCLILKNLISFLVEVRGIEPSGLNFNPSLSQLELSRLKFKASSYQTHKLSLSLSLSLHSHTHTLSLSHTHTHTLSLYPLSLSLSLKKQLNGYDMKENQKIKWLPCSTVLPADSKLAHGSLGSKTTGHSGIFRRGGKSRVFRCCH